MSSVESLYEITGCARKSGIGLRPPKQVLRVIHLIREIAGSVAFRPISFENKNYYFERIDELKQLEKELEAVVPYSSDAWKTAIESIRGAIAAMQNASDTGAFVKIVAACDRSRYREHLIQTAAYIPRTDFPLLKKKFREIFFITGPAIGLGDEIACIELIDSIHAAYADAALQFFCFYPGLWRVLKPESRVHSLVGDPMKMFRSMDEWIENNDARNLLVVFINFSGLDMHRSFCVDTTKPDIAEIAVGKRTLWFAYGDGGPIQVEQCRNPLFHGNYRALKNLSLCLTGICGAKAKRPHSIPRKRSGGAPFNLVINPFTSKQIVLSPADWFHVLAMIADLCPGRRTVSCTLIPGLSKLSADYAAQIRSEFSRRPLHNVTLSVLNQGAPMHPGNAVFKVYTCVRASDLIIGMDTYTAHLAAALSIPSIALCHYRNSVFWSDNPSSLWIELRHGLRFIGELCALLFKLCGGLGAEAGHHLNKRICSDDFARFEAAVREDKTECNQKRLCKIFDLGSAAWDHLPHKHQSMVTALDAQYPWTEIRTWSRSLFDNNNTAEWMADVIRSSHFRRICHFIALFSRVRN